MPGMSLACRQMRSRGCCSGAGWRAVRSRLAGPRHFFDSSLVQLLTRLDLDLRVAVSDRGEWCDVTQPRALAERWRRLYPGQSSLRNRAPAAPSASVIPASSGRSSSSSKLISLTPADMKRKILLTSQCLGEHRVRREKGESFRAERYLSILGQSLEQTKVRAIKVQHTKSCITKRLYGKSDLKYDLKHGLVTIDFST